MVMYMDKKILFSSKNLESDVDRRITLELMLDLDGHNLYTDNYYNVSGLVQERHQLWYSSGE